MITIRLIDDSPERYTQRADTYCLGRMYDHIAEEVEVVKPKSEENNVCAMMVKANGKVVDHIIIGNEPIKVTSNLSQYESVTISFSFSNASGYIKNAEPKNYYFAYAEKPSDFVPMPPEQWTNVDLVVGGSFTRAVLEDEFMVFYNLKGQELSRIDLSDFGGAGGGILKETDPTVPNWAKQPNKPTYKYEEILDTPTIPSTNGLASEVYVDNKTSATLNESKGYTDTKIADLVGTAPTTLDTIGEIATALNNNPNVVTALNNAIGTKQSSVDNNLQTTSKTIVGAINEINGKISSANTQLQNILGV